MSINRAYIYGDLLFETIAIVDGKMSYDLHHFIRISRGADLLNFQLPLGWNEAYFKSLVLNNCSQKNVRARLIIYRLGNGFYLSNTNEVGFDIEFWPLPKPKTEIEELDVFVNQYKACNTLANFKTGNALVYVLAAQFVQQKNIDDALILNEKGNIAEATSSNIFWVKNEQVYTPPLSEGPIAGVMRQVVMDYCLSHKIELNESPLSIEMLLDADECFLTNVLNGVCSVKNFRTKRFDSKVANKLKLAFSK